MPETKRRGGRSTIDDNRRKNVSKRAQQGTLGVVRLDCEYCGHHKCFTGGRGVWCCRCKRYVDDGR